MNINAINKMDVTDSSDRVSTAPPRGVDPGKISRTDKIQKLKTVEQTKKTEKQDEKLTSPETKELVETLNEYMDDLQTNLGFSIREDLDHQVVVEIKNRQTNELVKQIPSEELLIIMEKMKELNGFIFDQSV